MKMVRTEDVKAGEIRKAIGDADGSAPLCRRPRDGGGQPGVGCTIDAVSSATEEKHHGVTGPQVLRRKRDFDDGSHGLGFNIADICASENITGSLSLRPISVFLIAGIKAH